MRAAGNGSDNRIAMKIIADDDLPPSMALIRINVHSARSDQMPFEFWREGLKVTALTTLIMHDRFRTSIWWINRSV